MAKVSTYLNFKDKTEEAFLFYKSVFGGEFIGNGMNRFGEMPTVDGMPPMPESVKKLIMHVELPILDGHSIMGTDAPEEMGFKVNQGNNIYISLEPDSRAEADRLFKALSQGGVIEQQLQEMFWGAYFGSFRDKFGVGWMINCHAKE